MKKIDYIKQPTEYLCGQACVAMLVGATVEEVVAVMKNDKGTLYHKAKIQLYLEIFAE